MAEEDVSRLRERLIDEEMKESFMDYAMSVIVSRALPDARDGMKPVHRRILYAMFELGMTPDKPFKKIGKNCRRSFREVPPSRRLFCIRYNGSYGARF